METNLLDRMLASYRDQRTAVTVSLQNKVRLTGAIRDFDSYVIILEGPKNEIIYRHAVSSIAPAGAAVRSAAPPQRKEAVLPAPRTEAAAPAQKTPRQKGQRPAPKAPASPDAGLNSGMREGLLRWMQEQKAPK